MRTNIGKFGAWLMAATLAFAGSAAMADTVAKIGEAPYETLAAAVAAAETGDKVEIVKADSYKFPGLPKNITLSCCDGVIFDCEGTGSISSVPNGCTVIGGTFNMGQNNYHGWQHAGAMAFNGSAFNGKFFGYANLTFTGCHFVQTAEDYCMWTYSSPRIDYINCTFDCKGKAVNVYWEQHEGPTEVTADGCTFNSSKENKPALKINSKYGAFVVATTANNTLSGFPRGISGYDDEPNEGDYAYIVTNAEFDEAGKLIGGDANREFPESIVGQYFAADLATVSKDNEGNWKIGVKTEDNTIITTEKQESKVEVPTEIVKDAEVVEKIEQSTKVEGVKLSATATEQKPAGIVAVVEKAKENTAFAAAVEAAAEVSVKVEVEVKPTEYDNTADKGKVAFKLTPKATVTVKQNETELKQEVPVSNDMIDQNQKIAVSIYTGFAPATIVHKDDDGTLIEVFSGDGIVYDEKTGVATVEISHFSSLFASEEKVDPYIEQGYVKVSDGFYQNGATYTASTDFYITSKAGLEYFRDIVNSDEVANAYRAQAYGEGMPDYTANYRFKDKTVNLLADVDLNNETWTPIGWEGDKQMFAGTFDGNNHVVSNLKTVYTTQGKDQSGLFGFSDKVFTIKNLTLNNVDITGYTYVGALISTASSVNSQIVNCHVTGSVSITAVSSFVGGIVGHAYTKEISGCSVEATGGNGISCSGDGVRVGGICGYNQNSTAVFKDCHVKNVDIAINHRYLVGGIVGTACFGSKVVECSVENVNISCNYSPYFGLLVGRFDKGSGLAIVEDCTAVNSTATGKLTEGDATTSSACQNLVGRAGTAGTVGENAANLIVGSNIAYDESGKIVGGTYEVIVDGMIATGYEKVAQGTTPETWVVQEKAASPYWSDHAAAAYSTPVDVDNKILTIATPEELALFAKEVNEKTNPYNDYTINITKDIDLSAYEWVSIIALDEGAPYYDALRNATIEGNGNTISGMTISASKSEDAGNRQGFIGYYGEKLTIKNLTFDGANVTGRSQVGVVIGSLFRDTLIENVHVVNSVMDVKYYAGAIVGFTAGSANGKVTIKDCTCENVKVTEYYDGEYSGIMVGLVNKGDSASFENSKIKNDCVIGLSNEFIGCSLNDACPPLSKMSEVDGWWYPTLADGIAAVEEDGEVELLANCAEEVTTDRTTGFTMKLADGVTFTGKVTGPEGYALKDNGGGTYTYGEAKTYVAEIFVNGESVGKYETLAAALAAAGEHPGTAESPTVVQLAAGIVQEGDLSIAAMELSYVTFQGADDLASSFKDCEIGFQSGYDLKWAGVTFRGIMWDNARIVFSTFKNENLTFDGNKFVNLKPSAIEATRASVHFTAECKNFTYVNNVYVDPVPAELLIAAINSNGSGLTGNITLTNNVIRGSLWRSLQMMFKSDDGVADNFTITDNWFEGNKDNVQIRGSGATSADTVAAEIRYNVFDETSDSIYFFNTDPAKTTVALDHNFWSKTPDANPAAFYVKGVEGSADNIADFGVYPYYNAYDKAALEAGTKTVREALYDLIEPPATDVAAVISADGATTNKFSSLQAAVDAANAGETIVMLCDATEGEILEIGKSITIDLDGKKLTLGKADNRLADGCANVTIRNGELSIDKNVFGRNGWYDTAALVYGTLTLDTVTMNIEDYTVSNIFQILGSGDDADISTPCDSVLNVVGCAFSIRSVAKDYPAAELPNGGPKPQNTFYGYCVNGGTATMNVKDSTIAVSSGYSVQAIDVTLDRSSLSSSNMRSIVWHTANATLKNGSTLSVDKAPLHGFTNGRLIVGDGCTVDMQDVGYLGINLTGESRFASGSKVRVVNCATGGANYTGLGLVVTGSGDLTVESGADVQVSNAISSGWKNADNCGTINIADGRYGSVTNAGMTAGAHITLTGGVYANEPDHSYAAEGYEVQANADPFTKDDYPWAVDKKAFEPASDPETGTVEPITVDIMPAGQTPTAVPVKVSEEAVKAMVEAGIVTPVGEKATAKEVSDGLKVTQNNDQTVWQNYVMGVDGTKKQNELATIGEKAADKPKEVVVVKTPIAEFNPPQNTGVTVTYRLLKSLDGKAWEVYKEGLAKPEFDVDTSKLAVGDSLWKIEAVFSAEKPTEK